jgi:thiamine kinase-like enzyme
MAMQTPDIVGLASLLRMHGLEERVARLLGAHATSWQRRSAPWQPADAVAGGNDRFTVRLDDGRRVFVKAAKAPHTARWLRREAEVYANLRGSFIAELIAFEDDPIEPLLVLDDHSDADWSVHWDAGRVTAVRRALAAIATSLPPPNTPAVRDTLAGFRRWDVVRADPEPFLSTGLRSREWLDRALPTLQAAADTAPIDGDDLVHLDVRSDNLCFRNGAAILVDWNWCSTGRAEFDVAAWLPSLAFEGGPQPWEVLPHAGGYAAFLAGIWAAVVGLPPPPTAPTVRDQQRRQLEIALAWCERELPLG